MLDNHKAEIGQSSEPITILEVRPLAHTEQFVLVEIDWWIYQQVNNAVMRKVVEWCEHHCHGSCEGGVSIQEWDHRFMQIDVEVIINIIKVLPSAQQ